jgi:RNA polymerase sigma factor (sigma-70 family)
VSRWPARRDRRAGASASAEPAPAAGSGTPSAGPPRLHLVPASSYPDWNAVYRDNVERVYRLMYAKVGNRQDAEDLTAEVFLVALRPLRLDVSGAEVRAYLLAAARTVLAGHWRRTFGAPVTTLADDLDAIPLAAAAPEPAEISERSRKRARALLDALPERYRRVLQLRFLHAYSLKEAADELGVTVANVKVLQHRALRAAARLADKNEEEGR